VQTPASFLHLLLATPSVPRVVFAVVFHATRLAPDLMAVAAIPSMEVDERLLNPAASTSLHCQIRLQIGADEANRMDMSLGDHPSR